MGRIYPNTLKAMLNNQDLQEQIDFLEEEIFEMKNYFDEKSNAIISKCVKQVTTEFRKAKRISILQDDYSDLNTFEQICFIIQEKDIDDYIRLNRYIEGVIEASIEKLSKEEQFILNHSYIDEISYEIFQELHSYCLNYTNMKIRKHLDY